MSHKTICYFKEDDSEDFGLNQRILQFVIWNCCHNEDYPVDNESIHS